MKLENVPLDWPLPPAKKLNSLSHLNIVRKVLPMKLSPLMLLLLFLFRVFDPFHGVVSPLIFRFLP